MVWKSYKLIYYGGEKVVVNQKNFSHWPNSRHQRISGLELEKKVVLHTCTISEKSSGLIQPYIFQVVPEIRYQGAY